MEATSEKSRWKRQAQPFYTQEVGIRKMSQKPALNNLKEVENCMNGLLERLGLDFRVGWQPNATKKQHANVNLQEKIIHVFDTSEDEAWKSVLHEVFEIKFRRIASLYQGLVNSLIDLIEKQVYLEKERFLESLPKVLSEFEKARKEGLEK